MPKFTYIIPFRYKPERIVPLKRVVEWLSGFNGIEILVVEQDKYSRISHMSMKATHIFAESEVPFNKAWAYNIAIRRTKSPVLVFGDGDIVMHPDDLIQSLRTLDSCDCVLPISNVIKLNPSESQSDLQTILNIKRIEPKTNMTDGISIFKRSAIERVGGWNEDILGLGSTNKFQDLKIKKMLSYQQLPHTAYHFYHRQEMNEPGLDERNKQILDFYNNPNSDLQQHISTTVPKSGFLNKYQF